MKKIFVKEDGTINIIAVFYSILIVLFLILLGMFLITKFSKKMTNEDENRITTTTKTTTTMKLCKDCNMQFIKNEYTLKTNESIDINNLLELKSINIKNVKFSEYDSSLIEIKATKEGVILKTLNKLGSTKIKANYQDKESVMTLDIFSDFIKSAKLLSENYYVYLDEPSKIAIETDPENVEESFFNFIINDNTIAEIKDGVINGKTLGKTNITLDYNGIKSNSNLYIIKNRIAIYVINNNENIEYSTYKTNTNYIKILVKCLDKDITKEELSYQINRGNIQYIEPDLEEPNAFIYGIDLDEKGEYNLEFSLVDGSKTGMKIIYE